VGLEISQSLTRFIPQMEGSNEKLKNISTGFWFYILSLTAFFGLSCVGSKYLANLVLDSYEKAFLFKVGLLSFILNAVFFFLQNFLRLERKVKKCLIINIFFIASSSLLAIYIILIKKFGVLGSFYGTISGSIIGILSFF